MVNYWLLLLGLLPSSLLAQRQDSVSVRPKTGGYIFSQQELQQIVDMAGNPNVAVSNIRTFDRRYQGLRGTPYLWPTWSTGYVVLTNGQRYSQCLLKYDTYRQELIIMQPPMRTDSVMIERERVSWFALQAKDGNGVVLFRHYPDLLSKDATLAQSYFRVLYSGSHTLLQRLSKSFRSANYKDAYSPDIPYDSFIDHSAYYLVGVDHYLKKVKLSRKSLLAALRVDTPPPPALPASLRKPAISSELDAIQLVHDYDKATEGR